jgi:hypothetical protein
MEPDRSRNFQMQLAERSNGSSASHQFIISTTMIAPELDDERYTVGKFSRRDDQTLSLPGD